MSRRTRLASLVAAGPSWVENSYKGRLYNEIGHDWEDILWYQGSDGKVYTAPSRADVSTQQSYEEAQEEIANLQKALKKGKFPDKKTYMDTPEDAQKQIDYLQKRVIDKYHPRYSPAQQEWEQLVHEGLSSEANPEEMADLYWHGRFEPHTGILTYGPGESAYRQGLPPPITHRVMSMPYTLERTLESKFPGIKKMVRMK